MNVFIATFRPLILEGNVISINFDLPTFNIFNVIHIMYCPFDNICIYWKWSKSTVGLHQFWHINLYALNTSANKWLMSRQIDKTGKGSHVQRKAMYTLNYLGSEQVEPGGWPW